MRSPGFRLMILLYTVLLLCAACGRGSSSATPEPTPLPSTTLTLDQTYTDGDGRFAFNYPAVWIVRESGDQVLLGTSPEALDATGDSATAVPGQFVVGVSVFTAARVPGLTANAGPREVLGVFANDPTGALTYTAPTDLAIGGHRAARVQATGSSDETFIIAMEVEAGVFAVLAGGSAGGQLANFEPTVLAIAETIRYSASGNVMQESAATPEVSG